LCQCLRGFGGGRYDFVFSLELSQDPLFTMLGSPTKDKQHLVLEAPHDVTEERPQLVKAVLDWHKAIL
jgi:hypothetical protein